MKVIKHLSLIGSAALLTTPMFAKARVDKKTEVLEKEPVAVVKNEAPGAMAEKAAPSQQPVKVEKTDTKEAQKEPQEVSPTKEQIASYLKTLGWMTIMQCGVKNLGCNAAENEAFLEGVRLALDDKEAPAKLGEIMQPMQNFLQKRAGEFEKKHQEELKMLAEKNRKEGDKFMADLLKKDSSIKTTASGLSYKILAEGDNKIKPTDEDSVEIYYTGKLIDGKVFDESKTKPIIFPLSNVIEGIKEGLKLIGQGGKITLYIPDHLGYKDISIPGIPVCSFLIFELELTKVIRAEKAPKEEVPAETSPKAPKTETAKESVKQEAPATTEKLPNLDISSGSIQKEKSAEQLAD